MTPKKYKWASNEVTGELLKGIQKDQLPSEDLLNKFIDLKSLPTDIKQKATEYLIKLRKGILTLEELDEFSSILHRHRYTAS